MMNITNDTLIKEDNDNDDKVCKNDENSEEDDDNIKNDSACEEKENEYNAKKSHVSNKDDDNDEL